MTNKLKEFTVYFGFEAVDEPIKEYNMTKDDGLFILDICHTVMRRLKAFKIEHSYFTFADIAIMAIDIVKKFPDVREEIKNKYHEILIDEYQDTSDLQEAFYFLYCQKQCLYGWRY
ncbi:MAG: UvrD-helicase domain-containing protein [Clostridium sp.]|nr:MAG: UvrD-helicase domain-containing protein [Clostridium sp.]